MKALKWMLPALLAVLAGSCAKVNSESDINNIPVTPAWALGHIVWEDEFNTQDAVNRLVDGYLERGIPVNGVIIDSPWTTSYNNFTWDTNLYPDPKELTSSLLEKGVHSILWLTGCVNTVSGDCPVDKSSNYDEAVEKGYAVNGGKPYDWWKGTGVHIDFTNPEATEWWYSQIDKIMATGVDGFKVDQGEVGLPEPVVTSAGEMTNKAFRPFYYDAMYDYANSRKPGIGIILARPYSFQGDGDFSNKNKLSLGWCGDFDGTWQGLKDQLKNIYISAEHGYGAVGTEIGGYFGTPPGKDQLIRYSQFAAMTATMINGGGHGPFENHLAWWHGEDAGKIYKDLVLLHHQLVPYIFSTLVEGHLNGGTLIRDVNIDQESHRFGPDIFTKAITDYDSHVSFTLPEGDDWIEWESGECLAGGSVVEKEYALNEFPLYVRVGSAIPMDKGDRFDIQIVPGKNPIDVTIHLPDGDGTSYSDCRVRFNPLTGKSKITGKTSKPCQIVVREPEPRWEASWIGINSPEDVRTGDVSLPARYLRTEFESGKKVAQAKMHICGLGLYEAYVNGHKIGGAQVLSPTVSNYDKTVYYNSFDVTGLLRKGTNAVGVILGTGRFPGVRVNWDSVNKTKHYDKQRPCLLFQLEIKYSDGSVQRVLSGKDWKATADGPIRSNNEYDGEIYDARMELGGWLDPSFDDSTWHQAEAAEAPYGKLTPQPNPNIAIQDFVKPVSIKSLSEGRYILDMGQNMVGWLQVKARMSAGDTLKMRFAETLQENGELYTENLRTAKARDYYIAGDDREFVWHPLFVYHGFRFVEVSGLSYEPSLEDFEGQVIYDKMATTGHFECSDPVINQVYKNAFWGIRGNYRGMPTDCPQRDERMGWLGDRATGCYGESWIFDNHALYSKWLDDIATEQNEEGQLPSVAPNFWTVRPDNMTWPGLFIDAARMLWQRFGDEDVIVKHYPAMRKWLAYMKERYMVDGIMTKDNYGDWCMPPESLEMIHSQDPTRITAPAVIATPYYVHYCQVMTELAPVAGYPGDVEYFEAERKASTEAFNRVYYNQQGGYYDNNTVTANLLALWFGLVPREEQKRVFASLVDKTENEFGGHVSSGVIGIQVLMRTLTEYGRPDLALKIASDTTYPSWGYMAARGATTIWELWNGDTADPAMNSGNHVMLLGDLITWEYEYLAGIRPLKPGFAEIELRPYPISGLEYVDCSYDSVRGRISSSWKVEDGVFKWDVEVPEGIRTEVYIPGSTTPEVITGGHHHFETRL